MFCTKWTEWSGSRCFGKSYEGGVRVEMENENLFRKQVKIVTIIMKTKQFLRFFKKKNKNRKPRCYKESFKTLYCYYFNEQKNDEKCKQYETDACNLCILHSNQSYILVLFNCVKMKCTFLVMCDTFVFFCF